MDLSLLLNKFLTTQVVKLIVFIAIIYLANRWSEGRFVTQIAQAKKMGHRYGWTTVALVAVWWLITPSGGTPDDLITVWLIKTLGWQIYLAACLLLTMYLWWRLRVTIVIYKK